MNIFKILANGDGSINEPNVSAFLGYLLDPKEDHGLQDQFLKRILEVLVLDDKNDKSSLEFLLIEDEIRNISSNSVFEFEILLEQAFQGSRKKREIVDIIMLCYEKPVKTRENYVTELLSKKISKELKHIFLIENKIRDAANTNKENQLSDQVDATLVTLGNLKDKNLKDKDLNNFISVIFISPNQDKSNEHYSKFKVKHPKIVSAQIYWGIDGVENEDGNETSNTSISNMLKEIIYLENEGKIDPVYEYLKHTLKSFILFIQSNFKSIQEEKLSGKYIPKVYDNLNSLLKSDEIVLSDNSKQILEKFMSYLEENQVQFLEFKLSFRHSKTHCISIASSFEKTIFTISSYGKKLRLQLIFRGSNGFEESSEAYNRFKNIPNLKIVLIKDLPIIELRLIDEGMPFDQILKLFNYRLEVLNKKIANS